MVPLPLQGRILQPHLVGSSPIAFLLSPFLFHMLRWNAAPFPASTAAAHATLSRRCPFPVASQVRHRRLIVARPLPRADRPGANPPEAAPP
ncbi:hypothetical protein DAH51_02580 [Sphingobium yanoikuyae]|uniref:Uncharacterized protein n=1 Tax=Sphingobium yanoikuyae TaxID=13690 RepID=A0A430C941_SPHYA|nr:hypothetical protein DAH51_02580 [Sphingobium yanoikuyae]